MYANFVFIFYFVGRVLNIETLDVKFEEWTGTVNPDESKWIERGERATGFLNIIRLFYEGGPPANEQLGINIVYFCH